MKKLILAALMLMPAAVKAQIVISNPPSGQSETTISTPTYGGVTITGAATAATISVSTIVINGGGSSMAVSKATAPLTISINGNGTTGGASALSCTNGGGTCAFITQNGASSGYTTWENVSPGGNGRLYIVNNSGTAGDRGFIIFANDSDAVDMAAGNQVKARFNGPGMHVGTSNGNPLSTLDVAGEARSTATYVSGIIKVDGQTNFPGVAFSSAAIASQSTTSTSGFSCIPSSTLTWVSNGNMAEVKFSGVGGNSTPTGSAILNVLLDGVVVAPQNTTGPVAFLRIVDTAGNQALNMNKSMFIKPTAGARQVCLSLKGGASGASIDAVNTIAEFSVREW